MTLGLVGEKAQPYAGRAWLRRFPSGEVELLYRSGEGPSELERLNEWLLDAGVKNRVTRLSAPGFGQERQADDRTAQERESNTERTTRRAKQAIRWSAKAIGCDQMLTLTYRANVTDYAESRAHFQKFVQAVKRECPDFRYVAAPELQKRGAWHWHVGVKGWQNYDRLRGLWWRSMGYRVRWSPDGKPMLPEGTETPGNVQGVAGRTRGRRSRSWSVDRLASYLAKYVSKSIGVKHIDGKNYSVSRGLKWVVERYAVRAFTFGDVRAAVSGLLSGCDVSNPYLWTSSCRSVLWAAGRGAAPPPAVETQSPAS